MTETDRKIAVLTQEVNDLQRQLYALERIVELLKGKLETVEYRCNDQGRA